MKHILLFLIPILLFAQSNVDSDTTEAPTVYMKKQGTAGNQTTYQLVTDDSDFITELFVNADGSLHIGLRFDQYMSFRQQISEFQEHLAAIASIYGAENISSINLRRIVRSGDLLIRTSQAMQNEMKQFRQKKGNSFYNYMKANFMQNEIVKTFDDILKPYQIKTESVSFEKLFMLPGKEIHNYSLIETDSAKIPDLIFDCLLWLEIR